MKTEYLLSLSKKVKGINSSLFASTKFEFFTYERYYKYGHQFASALQHQIGVKIIQSKHLFRLV